ncbi:uncharacterized protein L969DRAFT_46392 [Mixia osmundae IAM 14324]|uniref:DAGKc domain-containing protein n=1 Tax=Mixia osmundae (strain CBS 9802 / IAM 14324 / JCM 22182 / KY 12970) TaxID=764103 RepID=G7DU59_MIXOS|nr:uncharacterized protein L969DRAFT_46392 [Mixia osmundae IAM 14324]KEI40985.1 hypothetical protein L969DRAFT_46392 [Mixia osmundae IAM 14324]GAA94119.1 hypothetical protein E5Q_00766 [Mixia osmundae IAM 14324]
MSLYEVSGEPAEGSLLAFHKTETKITRPEWAKLGCVDAAAQISVGVKDILAVVYDSDETALLLYADAARAAIDTSKPSGSTLRALVLAQSSWASLKQHVPSELIHELSSSTAPVHLVVNPSASQGRARVIAERIVVSLLRALGRQSQVHITQSAAQIKDELAPALLRLGEHTQILVCGGDGTMSELLNGLAAQPIRNVSLELATLPVGTANAFDAWLHPPEQLQKYHPRLFAGLLDLVTLRHKPVALTMAKSVISPSGSTQYAHVVVSFALHASILHDAEKMRQQHPGIDRFKLAAMQNVTEWHAGTLEIKGQDIQLYSPASKSFTSCDGPVTLDGPFLYLASSLIDRFEPTFIVDPLRRDAPAGTIDLVLMRPSQSGHDISNASKTTREMVAGTMGKVFEAMYNGGKHIDSPHVEIYRCTTFTFTPRDQTSEKHGLVCNDGTLEKIPAGGSVTVTTHAFPSIEIY